MTNQNGNQYRARQERLKQEAPASEYVCAPAVALIDHLLCGALFHLQERTGISLSNAAPFRFSALIPLLPARSRLIEPRIFATHIYLNQSGQAYQNVINQKT